MYLQKHEIVRKFIIQHLYFMVLNLNFMIRIKELQFHHEIMKS